MNYTEESFRESIASAFSVEQAEYVSKYVSKVFKEIASHQQAYKKGMAVFSSQSDESEISELAIRTLERAGYIELKWKGYRGSSLGYWSALADRFSGAYRAELTEKGLEWAEQLFPELYRTNNLASESV